MDLYLVSAPEPFGRGEDAVARMVLVEEYILGEIMLLQLPLPVVNDLSRTHVDLHPMVISAIINEDAAVSVPVRQEEYALAYNLLVGQTGQQDVFRSVSSEDLALAESGCRILSRAIFAHKHASLWMWHFEELLDCLGCAKICLTYLIDNKVLVLGLRLLKASGVELALLGGNLCGSYHCELLTLKADLTD